MCNDVYYIMHNTLYADMHDSVCNTVCLDIRRFWRTVTSAFPQVIDFLATVHASGQAEFEFRKLLKHGLTALFVLNQSYEMAEESDYFTPMHSVIRDEYLPSIAQWLCSAEISQVCLPE